jgi:hypothetical protein
MIKNSKEYQMTISLRLSFIAAFCNERKVNNNSRYEEARVEDL